MIDDHPIVAIGLTCLFEKDPESKVCGSADSAEAIPETFGSNPPDLFIIEINLYGADGFEILKQLARRCPNAKSLIFSHRDESFYAERALQCGATGYVMKSEAPDRILEAAKKVLAGEFYVSERLQAILLSGAFPEPQSENPNPVKSLSSRELQVLQLIGQGRSNREIARTMRIRQKTVEAHRFRIREKLNLRHGAELTQFAVHWVEQSGAVGQ